MSSADQAEPLPPSWRRLGWRARLRGASALALLALLGFGALRPELLVGLVRGELDLTLEPVYRPPFDVSVDAVSDAELDRVYGKLLPAWVLARFAQRVRPSPERRDREARTYYLLRLAVAADPNLVALFDELRDELSARPAVDDHRVDYLVWALNDYQRRRGRPYRVEGSLIDFAGKPQLYARTYRVAAELAAEPGELRLLRRLDSTNLVEGDLGHTGRPEDGALVLLDRVLGYTVRQLWPTLNPALDGRLDAPRRALARSVRAEAFDALSPDLLALLHEGAEDEQALIEVSRSVAERRRCGSTFRIWGLPWRGLSAPDREELVDALRASRNSPCPKVTPSEAARVIGASQRLAQTPELAPAVEELATWVARAVSVHELRHVADGEGPSCPGCPPSMGAGTRAELSAYVASLSTPGVGYLSLMQACHVGAGTESPHRRALLYLERRLLPEGCEGPPPDDLYRQAAALDRELFGARARAALPEDFPQRLDMLEPTTPSRLAALAPRP